MSPTTAPKFPEGPVTPATLIALLREARGFLHDAPRSGQQLGMRIDEALSQWDRPLMPMLAGTFNGFTFNQSGAIPAGHIFVIGDDEPSAFPVLFAPPEEPE